MKIILAPLVVSVLSAQVITPVEPYKAVAPEKAKQALEMSRTWQEGDPLPTPGENGTVVYQFGAAMPPIVSAPERLTTVLLEPGEVVRDVPILGDTSRWEWRMMVVGENRAVIVLKPKRPSIQTDMVIATNKRIYVLSLVSTEKQHITQVEFSYPAAGNFEEYKATQAAIDREKKTVMLPTAQVNEHYEIKGNPKLPFRPSRAWDNGHQTFLEMAPAAKDWGTAVLQTAGPNGCEIVNYRVYGDRWIVDRLFTSAELVSGTGKKAMRISITRDGEQPVNCSKKHGKV